MGAETVSLTAGMRQNLFSLQSTANLMGRTQNRLSTGKAVNTALDDPINFFAAAGHTQRATDLASRKDEMAEAVQTIQAANNGIEGLTELIENARSLAQSALSADTTTDVESLKTQYDQLRTQIKSLSEDSGYKGINLLESSTKAITVKFDETGASSITVTGFAGTAEGLGITEAGAWQDESNASTTLIQADITKLDTARTTLRSQAKSLASNLGVITTRQDFTSKMINTLSEGASNLTLADMNEEGANMLMLQTRQSLATTSLSLASQAAQSVLRLF